MQRRVITIMALFFSALLLLGGVLAAKEASGDDNPRADEPTTTTTTTANPGGEQTCVNGVYFWAQDAGGHRFGPAVPEEASQAQVELKRRLCTDPALAVALQEYITGAFSSPDERVYKTANLIQNQEAWRLTILAVTDAVAQGNPRIETMKGAYKTLYMVPEGRQIPEVYNASPDKPSFAVLRFDTPQGVKNLKLDCGFQPVEQSFPPAVPPKTTPPSPRQPKLPPPTVPKPPATVTTPSTTVPPTPSSTTVPPSPTTTAWKCEKGWKLVGGVWVCGGGGDVSTPPYQPPSTLPPTPGYNPGTTVPGSTIPPGATPPVSFAPTPPPEAPVTTDPPAVGDPCQTANPPAYC